MKPTAAAADVIKDPPFTLSRNISVALHPAATDPDLATTINVTSQLPTAVKVYITPVLKLLQLLLLAHIAWL